MLIKAADDMKLHSRDDTADRRKSGRTAAGENDGAKQQDEICHQLAYILTVGFPTAAIYMQGWEIVKMIMVITIKCLL